jgi:hypothetical protein
MPRPTFNSRSGEEILGVAVRTLDEWSGAMTAIAADARHRPELRRLVRESIVRDGEMLGHEARRAFAEWFDSESKRLSSVIDAPPKDVQRAMLREMTTARLIAEGRAADERTGPQVLATGQPPITSEACAG